MGGPAAICRDGHQHNGFTWGNQAHPVVHHHGPNGVGLRAGDSQLFEMGFGHPGVMLQFQVLQRLPVGVGAADATHKGAFSRWQGAVLQRQVLLPPFKRVQGP